MNEREKFEAWYKANTPEQNWELSTADGDYFDPITQREFAIWHASQPTISDEVRAAAARVIRTIGTPVTLIAGSVVSDAIILAEFAAKIIKERT
jgi:hypothetical protein